MSVKGRTEIDTEQMDQTAFDGRPPIVTESAGQVRTTHRISHPHCSPSTRQARWMLFCKSDSYGSSA